jgi:hypothetical protein
LRLPDWPEELLRDVERFLLLVLEERLELLSPL